MFSNVVDSTLLLWYLFFKIRSETLTKRHRISDYQNVFLLQGFSFTDIDDSQDCREREDIIFISLYHIFMLTNIQTFICNFACEIDTAYL